MKVLYVNHTSHVSGGERSLLTLLRALPSHIEPAVACPDGQLRDAIDALGITSRRIPGTAGSLRLHPWHTVRMATEVAASIVNLRSVASEVGADLVHANSIRAGVVASLVARLGGPPAVVHVRDCLPDTVASRGAFRLIGMGASMVLANSRYTAGTAARLGAEQPRVVHNPVDLEHFNPEAVDRAYARSQLGVGASTPVLVVLAQITPWKGQDDAVRALAAVRNRHPDARLLLVGSPKFVSAATRYDNLGYLGELQALVSRLGLDQAVTFTGEREDVPAILSAADVVLVPSWEEPSGRAVMEAMAMGVPVVATSVGGPPEIIRPNVDGVLLPPRDPDGWAAAIVRLLDEPESRLRMGASGRQRALTYLGVTRHTSALSDAYEEVLPRAPVSGE